MYLDPTLSLQDQWMVTKMIYGAQSDEFDFHMVPYLQYYVMNPLCWWYSE